MKSPEFSLRPATEADAPAIAAIYNRAVRETTATLDIVERSDADQRSWIAERSGVYSVVVAVDEAGAVIGFASLSPYRNRAAYNTTVEDSVYVREDWGGRGVGLAVLGGVIDAARLSGFHSVIARIEASSAASRRLHERCGFELVGVEREVGRKFGRWLDVAVMQRLL